MDRTIIDPLEQMRDFDFVMLGHDVLVGLGALAQDTLSGASTNVVGGAVASQTSPATLGISLTAGRIYTLSPADATAVGSIPADSTIICQQGQAATQILTLTAPSPGQSQWNLIQCQFQQGDAVRSNDPTSGVVPFYNASNPSVPNPTSINTVRQGRMIYQVIQGSAASTGSEVPPNPSANWSPLYLIDLAGGQTQITTGQILKAGPSAGTNVPANYPSAPFLAGLLAQHHRGTAGQAPQINLTNEVQGVLPYANMSPVRQLLGADLTLYVNASTGNDANNGLAPNAAFKTVQAAINSGYHNYDYNGFKLIISIANGTYTAPVNSAVANLTGLPPGCPNINLTGNTGSPGSVVFTATTSCGVVAQSGTFLNLSGITISATGTGSAAGPNNGCGIVSANGAWVNITSTVIGSCQNVQIVCEYGSVVVVSILTITGTTTNSFASSVGSMIWLSGATITVTGLTVAGTNSSVVFSSSTGTVNLLGTTWVGTATGTRYISTLNAVINTNGAGANFIPATIAGVSSAGGQYV